MYKTTGFHSLFHVYLLEPYQFYLKRGSKSTVWYCVAHVKPYGIGILISVEFVKTYLTPILHAH